MAENNPMMPDVAGIGVPFVRFAVRATVEGQAHLNYFYYSLDQNIVLGAAMKDVIQDFWSNLAASWLGCVTDAFQVQNIVARRIDLYAAVSTFKTGAELVAGGAAIQGSINDQTLPPQDAYCIKKTTAVAGKRGRGRWYISGIPESAQDGGQVTGPFGAALLGLCNDIFANFVGPASGATFTPHHVFWRETPVAPFVNLRGSVLRDVVADSVIRTQRRRQLGVGI